MSKEQEFMNFEQIADLILVGWQDLHMSGIIVPLDWALLYEHAKNPNAPQLAYDFKSFQQYLLKSRTRVEQPDLREKLEKIIEFVAQIEWVAKNPYDEKSVEFMARLKPILQAYYAKMLNTMDLNHGRYEISNINRANAEQYLILMLSRLNLMKDEQVKYNVLRFFYENPHGPLTESARQAFIMRANSVHATPRDLLSLMIAQTKTGVDLRATFQDLESIARRDLIAELAKEAPDLEKIKETVALVKDCANLTHDNAIVNQINQIYDVEKLLMPNATEYISKAPDAYTQKIAELESQIENLKQQVNEKTTEMHRLGRELDETKRTLTDAQAQNQTLNSENSALRQENSSLGLEKSNSETKLQKLIAGARQIKSGLGSRGVNEYKQMVEEMESGGMSI